MLYVTLVIKTFLCLKSNCDVSSLSVCVPSVKQEVAEDASGGPSAPVKLVKPVSEPGAQNQSQPERMTAAKLFTPTEVYV